MRRAFCWQRPRRRCLTERPISGSQKHRPLQEKRYLLTDQCFWKQHPPKDYNPLDPNRAPHAIMLVDVETGSVAILKSVSIIQVIEPA
jgi:hypothetical protein